MKVRFQFWRQLASEWASENPVLLRDEPGVEEDTGQWKFGDGVTAWNDLPYSSAGGSGTPGLSAYQVAVANGFVGTETQWLASLQGEDGSDSTVPGPQGPAGPMGPGIFDLDSLGSGWTAHILDDNELGYSSAFGGLLYLGDGTQDVAHLPYQNIFISQEALNLNFASKFKVGTTPPTDTNAFWIDTSS